MKSLVIIFSILLCSLAVNADKQKLTKQNNEELTSSNLTSSCATISNQISPLIEPALLVGSDSWPTTVQEINKHCELGAKVHKGFKRYGKCFTGIGRQAFNIFNRGLKKYMQNICSSDKKKQDTAEILKCASNETIGGWSKCLNKANKRLDITASNASDPDMVGNICCTYSDVLDCVALNTGSSPECGKTRDPTKFLQSSISFVLKDLLELLCANYETKEACATNAANQANILKRIADDNHQVNGTFILSPLTKAASLLGEVHADSI